jgi:hypothetical protein
MILLTGNKVANSGIVDIGKPLKDRPKMLHSVRAQKRPHSVG